jgi:hypothetical protein
MNTRLPDDLQQILDEVDSADRSADVLVAGLSDEQFRWQPDSGRGWSIAQCLEHLATTNTVYGAAVAGAIERARARGWRRRGPLASGFFGRRFVQSLEPPVKRRLRSPANVRPGSGLGREEVLRRYHDAHEHVRASVRASAEIDANRATFKNPFFPLFNVSVATGLRVIPAHDRRHLWQASRVREAPGFPVRFPASLG